MSTTPHPRAQLSAYLDGALAPSDRAAVDAHLDTCADCRTRLSELRATSRLIAALPDPRPARRLVPRVAGPPAWLAPLRTLTTLASGVSVFLFLATALLANVGSLAQTATTGLGGAAAAPAASAAAAATAPAFGAAAPESQRNALGSTASGVPAPVASLPSVPPLSTANSSAAQDAVKSAASASPSPNTQFAVTGTTTPQSASHDEHAAEPQRAASAFATPWLW